jgi:hypothetical protein
MTEKVGYGSPPVATRFKPGKSGNPRGRPRGTVNLATALAKVYTDTLTVREGDKKRRLPRLEALARKQMELAFKGDHRALQSALNTARSLGLLSTVETAHLTLTQSMKNIHILTDDELADMHRIFKKLVAYEGLPTD